MWGLWRFRRLVARQAERRRLRQAEAAIRAFPAVKDRQPHGLASELVVSLTSYPPRFPFLAATLKSVLDQTVAAERTVLWVAAADEALLPAEVQALESHGLTIRACEDLRSFKKLVPALAEWPAATIVTADDDVYYAPDWLASLVERARDVPGAVVGGRVHRARIGEDGALPPYAEWELATALKAVTDPREILFPTGVGGVLYPPRALSSVVHDRALFEALCPNADDVWFFWMARLAGTPHVGIGSDSPPVPWDGSQDSALFHDNWLGGGNDPQIAAMERHFGRLPELAPDAGAVAP